MTPIDTATLVNWIVSGLIGLIFGAVSAWATHRYERKRDDIAWEREKGKLRQQFNHDKDLLELQFQQRLKEAEQQLAQEQSSHLLNLQQEREKWERELAQRLAELKSSDPSQANNLARQFAVGYLICEQTTTSQREKVFIPPVGELSVGRGPENDIVLHDVGVSRRHASFRANKGEVVIFDLGTANGVRVNGQRVKALRKLEDGDIIEMGQQTRITFHRI